MILLLFRFFFYQCIMHLLISFNFGMFNISFHVAVSQISRMLMYLNRPYQFKHTFEFILSQTICMFQYWQRKNATEKEEAHDDYEWILFFQSN